MTEYAAGHDNALGVSIPYDNLEAFKLYCKNNLNENDFTPIHHVDLIINATEINGLDVLSLGDLNSLWGEGVEEPLIMIKNLHVHSSNIDLMKGSTIKITPANRNDNLSYILFKSNEDIYNNLYSEYGLITINLVGTCARNDWNG